MTARDFEQQPYTPDEQRVAEFIVEMTDGAMGGGNDPIGFLIALVKQQQGASRSIVRRLAHSVREQAPWRRT